MDWRNAYKSRLLSAEEAVKAIKSNDTVAIGTITEPKILQQAIYARRDELQNIKILGTNLQSDPGWYQPGCATFYPTETVFVGDLFRPCLDEKRGDYLPSLFSLQFKPYDERPDIKRNIDVFLTVVSPPDENGFCSFGAELWNRRSYARRAKIVIAEVDNRQIRTYGSNYIHASEIDYFVEYTPPAITDAEIPAAIADIKNIEKAEKISKILTYFDPVQRFYFLKRLRNIDIERIDAVARTYGMGEIPEMFKRIAECTAKLINNGDTIQIGARPPASLLARLGYLDNHIDLGYHGEMVARGIIKLVKEGVITGKKKAIHTGKLVTSALTGADAEEIRWASNNPLIEVYDSEYVINIRTISAHENMCAINSAISIDLTGQINAETTPGYRLWGGPGGQPESHIGAVISKGGKAITVIQSTAMNGTISRIMPLLDHGSAVTIPRHFSDYVVTEWGVANLMGKTFREIAEELIAVAHPDFRTELRQEAKKLFYP